MKTFIFISLCLTILLSSCGNSKTNEKEGAVQGTEEQSEKDLKSSDLNKAKDCDEFIKQYETWMDNYVDLLEKYMKNPLDTKMLEEYAKVTQESLNWMNQWNSKLSYCASKDKYEKRFNEISEKAEKKLKELGID